MRKQTFLQHKIALLSGGIIGLCLLAFGLLFWQLSLLPAPSTSAVLGTFTPADSSLGVAQEDYDLQLNFQLASRGYTLGNVRRESLEDAQLPVPRLQYQTLPQNYRLTFGPLLKQTWPADKVSPDNKNVLLYPRFTVQAPVVYAQFEDYFVKKNDAYFDFSQVIQEDPAEIAKGNYTSTPIQQKLTQGIVHLPFSPLPGEIGNSYIVGHSSNFSSVKSEYNKVFAPLESKSSVGDEFIIYDADGRELHFKVFEVKAIADTDVKEAYRNFGDRRVVTLQASILEKVNGKWEPTKRWLTRGELQASSN
jgi:hypothetical protein